MRVLTLLVLLALLPFSTHAQKGKRESASKEQNARQALVLEAQAAFSAATWSLPIPS